MHGKAFLQLYRNSVIAFFLLASCLESAPLIEPEGEWPQWLGPNRNGISALAAGKLYVRNTKELVCLRLK